MAGIGAKYFIFAPFDGEEPVEAKPKYGEAVVLGKLAKVETSIQMASGVSHGDDGVAERMDLFIGGTANVEVTDMTLEDEAIVYGASYNEETKELGYGSDDIIPYGGIAYIKVSARNNKIIYRGFWYPKVKASYTTRTATTRTDSITMANTPLMFNIFEPNVGKWEESTEFATFAEAKAWCDGKPKASA